MISRVTVVVYHSCIVSINLAGVTIAGTLTTAWLEGGLQVTDKGRLMRHDGELSQVAQLDLIVTYRLSICMQQVCLTSAAAPLSHRNLEH